ncbi:MAG TPA: fatty acid desaturase [Candidatus Limnocylindrales bacterium]|nr:fatty acid desaturase [Candidatus Limnocylindrales bacterium]
MVPLAAFFASVAHEIEHDLIHKCYFPTRRRVADAMLAIGWLMRPSTINPWIRRRLHLEHHRISGTAGDVEERAITNGMPMGVRRIAVMIDGLFAGSLLRPVPAGQRRRTIVRTFAAYFPLGLLHYGIFYLWVVVHGFLGLASVVGHVVHVPGWMSGVDFLFVVCVAPNVLRTFALHFVSSNLHYYGDIAVGDVLRQVQVLDRGVFLPLQIFCANFGSTHAIHHFYVPDPFYMRQLTAPVAHRLMREEGVRFNDVAAIGRANRYGAWGPEEVGA